MACQHLKAFNTWFINNKVKKNWVRLLYPYLGSHPLMLF